MVEGYTQSVLILTSEQLFMLSITLMYLNAELVRAKRQWFVRKRDDRVKARKSCMQVSAALGAKALCKWVSQRCVRHHLLVIRLHAT